MFKEKFPILISALIKAKQNNKLSHSYLVYGDNNKTREEFAIFLSQLIACESINENGEPCTICKTCQQIEKRVYKGLYILAPTSKSRQIVIGKDKNEEDSVRWFENLFYLSSAGGCKIGIIFDAECMNEQAQNAFLKTLEEPPSKTSFILVSGRPSSLLTTIRSRCQMLQVLENRCDYNFKGSQELFATLAKLLTSENNFYVAESCSAELISISKGLRSAAEEYITTTWQDKITQTEYAVENDIMTPAQKKGFYTKFENAKNAEYLNIRNYFISGIHSFYAKAYQLHSGINSENMTNYEIVANYAEQIKQCNEKIIIKLQDKSEELVANLNTNLDEELALKNFAYSLLN